MIRECLVICVYAQTHSTTVSFLTVANCYSELELMYQVAGFYMIYVFLSFTAVDCGNLTDQPMAVLITLLEQHSERMPPTVVTQATTWWETVLVLVKL